LTRIVVVGALLWFSGLQALAQTPSGSWKDAPGYLALFAPAGPRGASYKIYISPRDLGTELVRLADDPSLLHPPGAWLPAALPPVDAFGQTGRYDRSKLARVYGAKRATVARGPRAVNGRAAEAWTLISPYPNREMTALEPGTLLIVMDLGFP